MSTIIWTTQLMGLLSSEKYLIKWEKWLGVEGLVIGSKMSDTIEV